MKFNNRYISYFHSNKLFYLMIYCFDYTTIRDNRINNILKI